MHPRVFAALGPDLITNDVVAIIELVKNSYDALATRVDVRIREDGKTGQLVIEVEDNGTGMTRKEIVGVWAVVATPHRQLSPVSTKANRKRRVSGEKGLGRLSTARLGNSVELLTKAEKDRCWKVTVDWKSLTRAQSISGCTLEISPQDRCPFEKTGTLIRVRDLRSEWNEERFVSWFSLNWRGGALR
jgi:HSP90 family molecular chaperone